MKSKTLPAWARLVCTAAAALDDGQLQAWKAALDRRAAERYGGGPQLGRTQGSGKDDEAYLI